jgi:tRNA threonylcarbamoyladenosine biosynthesis protein TsaE
MSIGQTWQIESTSSAATLELAAQIGRRLKGGEVIELVSDLGGGKTTFVQGLAAGMGSGDKVTSPSFTLSNQYQAGNLSLRHFDFYRLTEAGILSDELTEILQDEQAVVVIEWADLIEDLLPDDRLTVTITATGESSRQLDFSFPGNLGYLIPSKT